MWRQADHNAMQLAPGTTLRLPGEFFDPGSSTALADPADYVTRLKLVMSKLKATPVRKQTPRKTHVHGDLSSSTHVFIRCDGVKTSLQKSYDGPYKVLKRGDKYFTVEVRGKQDVVSLDRLKPALMDLLPTPPKSISTPPQPDPSQQVSPPTNKPPEVFTPVTTRSGRRVHWPARFLSSLTLFTGGGGREYCSSGQNSY